MEALWGDVPTAKQTLLNRVPRICKGRLIVKRTCKTKVEDEVREKREAAVQREVRVKVVPHKAVVGRTVVMFLGAPAFGLWTGPLCA